jgi:hypothetical protein
MGLKLLRLLLCTIILTSCKQTEKGDFAAVTFYQYHLWTSDLDRRDLKDSSVFYFDIIKTKKGTNYNLRTDPHADSSIGFTYSINRDSLFYQSAYCEILDTVDLDYKGQKISLFRSNFDEQNSADEESYIFWNHDYGIVGVYNWSMGPILLYDDSRTPNFAKEVLYDYIVDTERRIK